MGTPRSFAAWRPVRSRRDALFSFRLSQGPFHGLGGFTSASSSGSPRGVSSLEVYLLATESDHMGMYSMLIPHSIHRKTLELCRYDDSRAVNNDPCAPRQIPTLVAPTALGPVDATLRIIHTGRARDSRLGAHPGSFPTRFGRPFLPKGWGSLFPFTRSLVRPAHVIVNPDFLSHVGPIEAVSLRTLELCQTVSALGL